MVRDGTDSLFRTFYLVSGGLSPSLRLGNGGLNKKNNKIALVRCKMGENNIGSIDKIAKKKNIGNFSECTKDKAGVRSTRVITDGLNPEGEPHAW